MNKTDTLRLLSVICATYPRHYSKLDTQQQTDMASVWECAFSDIPYEYADAGLKAYIRNDTSGFPPAPGQVRKWSLEFMPKPNKWHWPTAEEAWDKIQDSISHSGRYSMAEENFNKLPPILQKSVGGPSNLQAMALMPIDTLQSVEKSHFMRTYEKLVKEDEEEDARKELLRSIGITQNTMEKIGLNE